MEENLGTNNEAINETLYVNRQMPENQPAMPLNQAITVNQATSANEAASGNEATLRTGITPANLDAEIEKAIQMRETLNKLFNNLLQQGIDFDRIPGTDKPTLLKPGADLLCQVFHFTSGEPKIISSTEDFDKGILSYTVSVPLIHRDTNTLVSVGIGSANSYEVKYKYRYVDADGEKVRIENPEPADQQNTLIKMAAKRAYIDAVLKATGASRMFTQDIEDMAWLQPEKASSKQINYIKMLYKDVDEDKALEDISGIVDRKVESWDKVTREEASKIIEAKKKKGANPASERDVPGKRNQEYIYTVCKARITQGVAAYSRNKYGKLLCEKCQKAAGNPVNKPVIN